MKRKLETQYPYAAEKDEYIRELLEEYRDIYPHFTDQQIEGAIVKVIGLIDCEIRAWEGINGKLYNIDVMKNIPYFTGEPNDMNTLVYLSRGSEISVRHNLEKLRKITMPEAEHMPEYLDFISKMTIRLIDEICTATELKIPQEVKDTYQDWLEQIHKTPPQDTSQNKKTIYISDEEYDNPFSDSDDDLPSIKKAKTEQLNKENKENSFDIDMPGIGGVGIIGNELTAHNAFPNFNMLFSGISIPPAKLSIEFPSFNNAYINREGDTSTHEHSISNYFVGYLASQALTPGITCFTDMINGNNYDSTCYNYYKNTFNSSGKLLIKTAISNAVFGFAYYQGANLVNTVIASKIATDIAESIAEGNFYIDPQVYATGVLQYIAKMGATTLMCTYFAAKEDVATAILINLAPALIDLGASVVYQGAVMVDGILNLNGNQIDFDYYL